MKDHSRPVKHRVPAVLVWSFLGCQATPPEPPPVPDHLAEDVKRLGAELLACRQAENDRLRKEAAEIDAEIAETKRRIAVERVRVGEAEYRRIMGDGGALARKPAVQP